MDSKKTESVAAADAAAVALSLAQANIKNYIELHSGDRAQFIMKLAEEASAKHSDIVQGSVELAIASLQDFLKAHKGGK